MAVTTGRVWEVRYRASNGATPAAITERALYVCAEDIPDVCKKIMESEIGQSNTFKGIRSVVEYQTAILF